MLEIPELPFSPQQNQNSTIFNFTYCPEKEMCLYLVSQEKWIFLAYAGETMTSNRSLARTRAHIRTSREDCSRWETGDVLAVSPRACGEHRAFRISLVVVAGLPSPRACGEHGRKSSKCNTLKENFSRRAPA